jgi:hypothetical protein
VSFSGGSDHLVEDVGSGESRLIAELLTAGIGDGWCLITWLGGACSPHRSDVLRLWLPALLPGSPLALEDDPSRSDSDSSGSLSFRFAILSVSVFFLLVLPLSEGRYSQDSSSPEVVHLEHGRPPSHRSFWRLHEAHAREARGAFDGGTSVVGVRTPFGELLEGLAAEEATVGRPSAMRRH